jgi:expansin (peptidoglycan-binding protein)
LAENFRPDTSYTPGTVVALGGAEEITAVNDELSDSVFGVISNKPAYLMNSAQDGGAPVAVAGRVPVRVVGLVNKGDRLVSAGNGTARAAQEDESINAFNVIGRAIESKTNIQEGTVEAFVTIN